MVNKNLMNMKNDIKSLFNDPNFGKTPCPGFFTENRIWSTPSYEQGFFAVVDIIDKYIPELNIYDTYLPIETEITNNLLTRYPAEILQHVKRVARSVKDTGYDNDYVNIALLHDIIEDTETVIEEIPDSYRSDILLLTRTKEETYKQYINRIVDSNSLRAIIIKLYDLRDHLDQTETLPESLFDRYYNSRRILRNRYLYLSENSRMANGEEWMHASKEEIENMTWEEARKIIIGQIEMGMDPKDPSCWGPREFLTHALKMVLHRADGRGTRSINFF